MPARRPDRPRVLVGDDQPDVRAALRLLLAEAGIDAEEAGSPGGVLAAAAAGEFDAALVDLNYARDTTSGAEGLDLLQRLRRADPDLPVVVMTAWATIDLAVRAIQAGARDFVEKPWDNPRVLSIVRNQIDLSQALRRARRAEAESAGWRRGDGDGALPGLVAESPAMAAALALAERVAAAQTPVLLTGENGTGKSLLARHLHARSARAARPFVEVNAGAIPDALFESEMFGHVRGAFTDAREARAGRFALADGGTLFLDEIGNLPLAAQAKLLRVLEGGEFEPVGASRTQRADVRIVAATNTDLPAAVAQGRFRQDLLFRLNTVEIRIPPLRERRADLAPLAAGLLARAARRAGRQPAPVLDPDALRALEGYAWPGNVRELSNVIERAVLLATGPRLAAEDLRLGPAAHAPPGLEEMSLEDAERALLRAALRRHGGRVLDAAQALGLTRSAMYRRLEKLGVRPDE